MLCYVALRYVTLRYVMLLRWARALSTSSHSFAITCHLFVWIRFCHIHHTWCNLSGDVQKQGSHSRTCTFRDILHAWSDQVWGIGYVMLCYVMLCYVMLCYVMLCCCVMFSLLCCAMLCHAMLYYISSAHLSKRTLKTQEQAFSLPLCSSQELWFPRLG